ncbi:ras GEF [Trametes polyzona]|nr:ras GEF [Trametes polyzona]
MMTPKNHPIDLPKIPSLPPIQMPDSSSLFGPAASAKRSDSPASRLTSSPPYASQDTFLTAHTSLSPDQPSSSSANGSPAYLYLPAPSAMTSPTGLRKSISVDSFVKNKAFMPPARPTPPSPLSSDFRASQADSHNQGPASARPADASSAIFRPSWTDQDRRAQPSVPSTRSRGTSISTAADDRDAVFLDESDIERSEELSRRTRKGKGSSKQSIRPGELPMPSRLQPKGSVPSMHIGPFPPPIIPARSSSLNFRGAKQKSLGPLHTDFPTSQRLPEISLLVIGPHGCGKSTIIQKGLKQYGLGKPKEIEIKSSSGRGVFTYTQRKGTIPPGQGIPEHSLRVLEADVSTFNLSDARGIWSDATEVWDGVVICYDATDEHSLRHVEDILRTFGELRAPCIAIACKTDLTQRVNPKDAHAILQQYQVGLIEVSTVSEQAKERIRMAFEWILASIFRDPDGVDSQRNPASPAWLLSQSPPPWDISRASSATPTASSSAHTLQQQSAISSRPSSHAPSSSISQTSPPTRGYHRPLAGSNPNSPSSPTSPTRVRSTGDLLSEHEKSKREEREVHASVYKGGRNSSHSSFHAHQNTGLGTDGPSSMTDVSTSDGVRDISMKESRAPPWMSLEDLLNKLLFMAVCDDDPVFISHFLLTYRRFASPRAVLLSMQKRMRSLDHPTGDPMFACYAQMRICQLLDLWINMYPTDFAVPGASSALAALIKSIITKTYLLHYGAEFLPFLEMVSSLKDKDASWALKVEEEASDNSSVSDEEHAFLMGRSASPRPASPSPPQQEPTSTNAPSAQTGFTRARKASLPLSAKALITAPSGDPAVFIMFQELQANPPVHSPKYILRHLYTTSQALQPVDPLDIAQEITRIQVQFFLQIEPRHWLQHVLVQGRRDIDSDPITTYNLVSNHFGEWVVSLILCHDKPKARAKQIEKFIGVANRLRGMCNYSGLRAVIAGINSATFEGDESLELLRTKSPEQWKTFQQWDQLLQSVRSHQKYRMALRNTKGACIPALEIHLSDLIRAHEGNPDYHDDDPSKIHWAKFNMMARFIDTIVQCQKGCRESGDYDRFPAREELRKLFLVDHEELLMDSDMQRSRIALPDLEGFEDNIGSGGPRTTPRDASHHKDAAIFRKLLNFPWN